MGNKEQIAITIAFCALFGTLIISTPHTVYATTIFSDNFESGDYSNWGGTVNAADSVMQISSTTADVFQGNYSADCSIGSSIGTYAYAYYNFATVPVLYHREYIRISTLPPPGATTDLFGIMDFPGPGTHLATVGIRNDGSNYRWDLYYYDNGAIQTASSTAVNVKADTWYYVEIMVKTGSGSGQASLWIAEDNITANQASPIINLVNLTNDGHPIGTVFFGGYVTGASYPVHIYSDNVVVSDSWTGPRDFTAPNVGPVSANSHSTGAQVTLSNLVTDDVGIDYVIPSWNNTGNWVNQTAINANHNSSFIASFTGKWSNIPGTVVSAIFYANDTSNNWAASNQANFALSTYVVSLSANQTSLIQQDTVNISLSITKNGLPFNNYVANITRDDSLFAKNVTTNCYDTSASAGTHMYNTSSLYDMIVGENVTFTTNTLNVVWAVAPSPSPTSTPSPTPTVTSTPTPTPMLTTSPTPESTDEGLVTTILLAAIVVVAVAFGVIVTLLLLKRRQKLKK